MGLSGGLVGDLGEVRGSRWYTSSYFYSKCSVGGVTVRNVGGLPWGRGCVVWEPLWLELMGSIHCVDLVV